MNTNSPAKKTPHFLARLSFFATLALSTFSWAQNPPTPTPGSVAATAPGYSGSKILEIHKPLIPSAWGRVLQYRKEENFVLSGRNQETLFEFVFQNDEGIVRTATYHESADGNGYWEVYVWDEQ
jgi:hypothetical protein